MHGRHGAYLASLSRHFQLDNVCQLQKDVAISHQQNEPNMFIFSVCVALFDLFLTYSLGRKCVRRFHVLSPESSLFAKKSDVSVLEPFLCAPSVPVWEPHIARKDGTHAKMEWCAHFGANVLSATRAS